MGYAVRADTGERCVLPPDAARAECCVEAVAVALLDRYWPAHFARCSHRYAVRARTGECCVLPPDAARAECCVEAVAVAFDRRVLAGTLARHSHRCALSMREQIRQA